MKNSFPLYLLAIVLLLSYLSASGFTPGESRKNDSLTVNKQVKHDAIVISAVSMIPKRAANTAVFGDYLEVRVSHLDYLLGPGDTCCLEMKDTLISLGFNGIPHPDIPLTSFNRSRNSVIFHLSRKSEALKNLAQIISSPFDKIELSNVSLCIKGSHPLPTRISKFMLFYTSPRLGLWTLILVIVIFLSFFLLAKYTNILQVGGDDTRFSLAQTQMAFWTLIIVSSVVYIWLTTDNLPELPQSTLILMGISLATITGAKAVPHFDKNKPAEKPKKKYFLADILSDDTSFTIHRFQMVLWTIILGFIFVRRVFIYQQIPDFSDGYLILTGISSGTYVLLKTVEDRKSAGSQNGAKNSSSKDDKVPAVG